jgi:glycosyltransferase involved in cell wall biosynthesis
MKEARISVVINTYNAERYLESVIESVKGFDEVLICDMESTDNTLNIARRHGCRTLTIPKGNLSIVEPVRNFSIHQASHPWVLVIDADELVSDALRQHLYRHIRQEAPSDGLMIPRKNRLMGRFMHGYYPDYNLRFFRRDLTEWPPVIHSQPKVKGSIGRIPRKDKQLAIDHLDDRTMKERLAKINLYTEYEIEKRKDRHYGAAAFLYRPLVRFLKCYVLKGGFRDGMPGLLFAWLEAVQQFTILAKIYEHKHQEQHD